MVAKVVARMKNERLNYLHTLGKLMNKIIELRNECDACDDSIGVITEMFQIDNENRNELDRARELLRSK